MLKVILLLETDFIVLRAHFILELASASYIFMEIKFIDDEVKCDL